MQKVLLSALSLVWIAGSVVSCGDSSGDNTTGASEDGSGEMGGSSKDSGASSENTSPSDNGSSAGSNDKSPSGAGTTNSSEESSADSGASSSAGDTSEDGSGSAASNGGSSEGGVGATGDGSIATADSGVVTLPDRSVDLCDGLVTDTENHPMQALAKPDVGVTVTDPSFGTSITRISDVGGQGVIKPMYSPTQAWNADESYLLLYEVGAGHWLYDGKSYEQLRRVRISPPDLEQVYWSTQDPDSLFWIDGNQLMRYRVSEDSSEMLHAIDCAGGVSAESHGWISWDSNYLGLFCESSGTAFIYELDSGTIVGSADGRDAPIIAPSGTLAYWHGDVVDQAMNVLRALDLASTGEHSSLGMMENGHDTYNLVQFDPGPDGSGVGSLVTFDMTDGSSRVIVGPDTGYQYPPSGTHISAPIYKRPGWVFLSLIGELDGQEALDQEIVLANTNPGGKVCRIAHHRSQEAQDYWGEPHVTGSPSGTRAVFGSDWGGGASVDTYVVELPSYQ